MTAASAVEAAGVTPAEAVPLYPEVGFPEDAALPELPRLFDGDWVWEASRAHLEVSDIAPDSIRVRQFSHTPGRTALVSYVADWDPEAYVRSEVFALQLRPGAPAEFSRYPRDHALPGLEEAAQPDTALRLLNRHVLAIPRRTVRVDMVRYRPGSRAVLRHRTGRIRLYARVMRPAVVPDVIAAAKLIAHSGFVVPRVAGCWSEGGVVWLSEIPGKNVRRMMRRGAPPEPGALLDGLESLWAAPLVSDDRAFDLAGAYRRARRVFAHALRDHDEAAHTLGRATQALAPFVQEWRPSSIAHNDFYDDQMLALPDGRVAVVDFEEAGPGDPMLDVGNFLAHLRWAAHFGGEHRNDASGAYHDGFRRAALDRFGWSEHELDLREAACLFRTCTNTIRRPGPDWLDRTVEGLDLVNETLA